MGTAKDFWYGVLGIITLPIWLPVMLLGGLIIVVVYYIAEFGKDVRHEIKGWRR